ncbi:aminotransferase class I/II-fold pyridoxal phosphate-dependent enzyme [Pseudooceanicola aestuarii]|uniref:aminotransferase class I/II-fold pyridoxal phosphate-dependent enzyme n=1 Tax=Pseudooceanicola aestuarii TaxID=2697319 RepID=UPI0013D320BA|nr:aminotransferase class I/II-fold pyridoxal phosphate-dependent enzyme [Pseudooceanicola aestuarii]
MYPERFSNLPEYAFPRLRALLDHHDPGGEVVDMTIGEPKHPFPDWVPTVIADHSEEFGRYPPNDGTPALRGAIRDWVARRFGTTLEADSQIAAVNGTREALYNVGMALFPERKAGQVPLVLIPNPFYQVYMLAALSVAAEPMFVPATRATGYLPDYASLPPEVLNRVTAAYVCSPSNPQGAVASAAYWEELFTLAERHDFRILSDECYSEIYRDTPPPGALEIAARMGADPERVVLFESLSKRSNVPGLRSGFVAAGPRSMARIRQLRAYTGAPIPLPLQRVSERLWAEEDHVIANRALYAEKFAMADDLLGAVPGYASPEGGFFLWLPVPDGESAALRLWQEAGVRVLPGAYLSQTVAGENPGKEYIRVAMVAPKDKTARGLTSLRDCLYR